MVNDFYSSCNHIVISIFCGLLTYVHQAGATITWDIVVGGWELEYSAEFVPNAEGSYTIAVEKPRKMASTEEAVHNSYTSKESGKLVLSVDNTASRKRKVAAYRYVVQKSKDIDNNVG